MGRGAARRALSGAQGGAGTAATDARFLSVLQRGHGGGGGVVLHGGPMRLWARRRAVRPGRLRASQVWSDQLATLSRCTSQSAVKPKCSRMCSSAV